MFKDKKAMFEDKKIFKHVLKDFIKHINSNQDFSWVDIPIILRILLNTYLIKRIHI